MKNYRQSATSSNGSSDASKSAPRPGAVSAARLHQSTGTSNSFGGYTKVNHNNGSFSMRKTGR